MAPRRKYNAHIKRKVAADAKWLCGICGELLDETYELDHKIPLWKGGPDDIQNLHPLHASCHRKKTLQEEIERLENQTSGPSSSALQCMRCHSIVSPYFRHKCEGPSSQCSSSLEKE